jgi:hypothetical protein
VKPRQPLRKRMVPIPADNLEDERAAVRPAQLPFHLKGQFHFEREINDHYFYVFSEITVHF